jgi:hypothetical protein
MSVPINQDQEHLRLLSTFHYVMGGLLGFFGCIPLIHVAVGLMFMFLPMQANSHGPPPPEWFGPMFGGLFVVMGSLFCLIGWTMAVLAFLAGRKLARRQNPVFCQVVAGVLCLFMPLGTVLGVFTLIVLMRPSVQQLFQARGGAA